MQRGKLKDILDDFYMYIHKFGNKKKSKEVLIHGFLTGKQIIDNTEFKRDAGRVLECINNALETDFNLEQIKNKSRKKNVAKVRRYTYYFLTMEYYYPAVTVAEYLNRVHASVLYGRNVVINEVERYKHIRKEVEKIKKCIIQKVFGNDGNTN